jgi:GxxExxY protein
MTVLCASSESSGMVRGELICGRLTHSVIGAFFEVYNTLGFGFLEHLYAAALERELLARGHRVGREIWVPVIYKGEELGKQRLDMMVDEKLVIETKATHDLHKAAVRQVYNYLHATKLEVGLLLHFGPQPKFYRVLCRNSFTSPERAMHPDDPFHPMHPHAPFVLDAGSVSSDTSAPAPSRRGTGALRLASLPGRRRT